MAYFQRHLKNTQNSELHNRSNLPHPHPYPQPLRTKNVNRVKTEQSVVQPTKRSKGRQNSRVAPPPEHSHRNPPQSKQPARPLRFATQGPGHTESLEEPMRTILAETDNSMEEMLNSSIKQFQKMFAHEGRTSEEQSHLAEQNEYLKAALSELRSILQDKLDKALRKQKEELGFVLSDYLRLITKLLGDKEELTVSLQKVEDLMRDTRNENESLRKQLQQEKERQLKLVQLNESLMNKIQLLQQQKATCQQSSTVQRLVAQDSKIKTLYELLQRSQSQKKILQEALNKIQKADDKYKLIEDEYLSKLQDIQKQHEEQFMEYERAVRETLAKKEETIERFRRLAGSRVRGEDEKYNLY